MACSGRSTPLAREKGAQVLTDRNTAARTATSPRCTSPRQSSPSHMVESSTQDTPRRELAPTANNLIDSAEYGNTSATPQLHSYATADNTSAIPENKGLQISSSGQTSPARRSWRSLSVVQRLGHWLIRGEGQVIPNVETAGEDFRRYIRISRLIGNNDESEETLALFDTQCPSDWASVSFVRETWGEDFSGRPKSEIAGTLNGGVVQSFGRIDLVWSSRDNRGDWWPGKLSFKPKTYRASFEVIDTDDFDVIIGQKSIAHHKLLVVNNRLFGLFKAHRTAIRKVTQLQVADSQARADVRRAEAERLRSQADAQGASTIASNTATNGQ